MKICVAQTRPMRGDIAGNLVAHARLIEMAASRDAEMIVFPELSLTGYEPKLASELATDENDPRFDELQRLSDTRRITIGAGVPTKSDKLPCISMVLFQPNQKRETYSKQYLHADEEPFFSPGKEHDGLITGQPKIALAICYELSVPEHAEYAVRHGADVYIASVAKTERGVVNASERLADIAKHHAMTVLMSNSIGPSGDGDCAGQSAVWSNTGSLLAQLDGEHEGVLIVDTETQTVSAE